MSRERPQADRLLRQGRTDGVRGSTKVSQEKGHRTGETVARQSDFCSPKEGRNPEASGQFEAIELPGSETEVQNGRHMSGSGFD